MSAGSGGSTMALNPSPASERQGVMAVVTSRVGARWAAFPAEAHFQQGVDDHEHKPK
jgi:hypothetical protein